MSTRSRARPWFRDPPREIALAYERAMEIAYERLYKESPPLFAHGGGFALAETLAMRETGKRFVIRDRVATHIYVLDDRASNYGWSTPPAVPREEPLPLVLRFGAVPPEVGGVKLTWNVKRTGPTMDAPMLHERGEFRVAQPDPDFDWLTHTIFRADPRVKARLEVVADQHAGARALSVDEVADRMFARDEGGWATDARARAAAALRERPL